VWGPRIPRPVLPPRSTHAQYDHDEEGDGEKTDTEGGVAQTGGYFGDEDGEKSR
jgi:hypothetical protein